MKKNISLFCTKIIYLLFIIATAISMCIVYKNVENTLAIRFVIGYVIFAFLFLFYIIFIYCSLFIIHCSLIKPEVI